MGLALESWFGPCLEPSLGASLGHLLGRSLEPCCALPLGPCWARPMSISWALTYRPGQTLGPPGLCCCIKGYLTKQQVRSSKVKILKKPKFDITKLMELHTASADEDAGAALGRPEDEAAQNTLTAELAAGGAGEEE